MASLSGKHVAITGAGSGIGQALARVLSSRGALVSLADVNKAGLDETLKSLSGEGHFATVVDVSDSASVDTWIEDSAKRLGGLNGAANVAGVEREGLRRMAEARNEDWDYTMNINAKGVFFCMRAELNQMLKSGGSIVNVSSVAGLLGTPQMAIYSASKHAIHGLTKSAAREYGNNNIRVNIVAPGAIDTPMNKDVVDADFSSQALNRWASPTEVANIIAFLLSDDASFVTGACYMADGGWTA